nr:MAG TPA: hypothetical protein [Caudoviricetes sp.]
MGRLVAALPFVGAAVAPAETAAVPYDACIVSSHGFSLVVGVADARGAVPQDEPVPAQFEFGAVLGPAVIPDLEALSAVARLPAHDRVIGEAVRQGHVLAFPPVAVCVALEGAFYGPDRCCSTRTYGAAPTTLCACSAIRMTLRASSGSTRLPSTATCTWTARRSLGPWANRPISRA